MIAILIALTLTLIVPQPKPARSESFIAPWTRMDVFEFRVRCIERSIRHLTKEQRWKQLDGFAQVHDLLISACAWCGKVMGVKELPPTSDRYGKGVSHGACLECLLKQMKGLDFKPDPELLRDAADQLQKEKYMDKHFEKRG